MDKDELAAILDWMQAMHQGWRATNTAWLDLARSLKNYNIEKKFTLDTRGLGDRMDTVEKKLQERLAAMNRQPAAGD